MLSRISYGIFVDIGDINSVKIVVFSKMQKEFEKGVDKLDFIEYNNSRMTISH